ncbi:hypothetical protein [Clostridium sp. JNZ J1-5]
MKKKTFMSTISIIVLCSAVLWLAIPKKINASKVINLVQSNYKSITINDKRIEAGTNSQYLIDDFIPKLSRYTIKIFEGELPKNHLYKVDIKSKDSSIITLLDNDYLVINNGEYKILDGTIDLSKFYSFID